MTHSLTDICCASIPVESLPHLAALRTSTQLRVLMMNDRVWLRWPAGADEILGAVLPIHGVELFAYRAGNWYRPGRHLPVFDVPDDRDCVALLQALSPTPLATPVGVSSGVTQTVNVNNNSPGSAVGDYPVAPGFSGSPMPPVR